MPKQQIKIFENGTVKECFGQLITEGYRPATLKEVYDLQKKGKIENDWYCTGTIYLKGKINTMPKKYYKNISKLYEDGGRVLFVGCDDNIDYSGLIGDSGLSSNGRFCGIKK